MWCHFFLWLTLWLVPVKFVKDKIITSTTTKKEKKVYCVITNLGIHLFITTSNTNSSHLLTRPRVQTIKKAKENLRLSFQKTKGKEKILFFLPFLEFKTNKKILSRSVYNAYCNGGNDYINRWNSITGALN